MALKGRTINNSLLKYPVDASGSLLHFPEVPFSEPMWLNNEPFVATFNYREIQRGRSAAYFIWVDNEGRTFPMFMTDMADLIKNCTIVNGVVKGKWQVRKRGMNYGIALVTEMIK